MRGIVWGRAMVLLGIALLGGFASPQAETHLSGEIGVGLENYQFSNALKGVSRVQGREAVLGSLLGTRLGGAARFSSCSPTIHSMRLCWARTTEVDAEEGSADKYFRA